MVFQRAEYPEAFLLSWESISQNCPSGFRFKLAVKGMGYARLTHWQECLGSVAVRSLWDHLRDELPSLRTRDPDKVTSYGGLFQIALNQLYYLLSSL